MTKSKARTVGRKAGLAGCQSSLWNSCRRCGISRH